MPSHWPDLDEELARRRAEHAAAVQRGIDLVGELASMTDEEYEAKYGYVWDQPCRAEERDDADDQSNDD